MGSSQRTDEAQTTVCTDGYFKSPKNVEGGIRLRLRVYRGGGPLCDNLGSKESLKL